MQGQELTKIKAFIVGIVTILMFSFLFWEYFHGGVTTHYILHQKDLPSISNWWGGILLPVLTWFLLSRIERRLNKKNSETEQRKKALNRGFWIFLTGLVFGLLLSISFTYEYKPFLDNVLYIIIVLSFIIPVFYSEFILGFILGMTYTFGAIIPTVFILIPTVVGLVAYRIIRPIILILGTRIGNSFNKSAER